MVSPLPFSQLPPPNSWKPPSGKEGSGYLQFVEFKDFELWIQLTYRPTYKSEDQGGNYISHSLPTYDRPVGLNKQGNRV